MSDGEFNGRTALVTGGAKGIGRACCLRLARAGANVAVNYLSSEAHAKQTVEEARRLGVEAIAVRADVSDEQQVQAMVDATVAALGPIDLLVNNAGVFYYKSHEETTLEMWRHTLDVNLTGVYLTTWAVKDQMRERKQGGIVNVSSISGLRPRPLSIAYAASKAGVLGLTRSLAEALAPDNIRVNGVAPGLIETDIIADVDQSLLDKLVRATPMDRIGRPEEIADLVYFLLSDQSSFMTGQTVVASGGRVMLP